MMTDQARAKWVMDLLYRFQGQYDRTLGLVPYEAQEACANEITTALRAARGEAIREDAQDARFGAMELRAAYEARESSRGDWLQYGPAALQDFADILDAKAAALDAQGKEG